MKLGANLSRLVSKRYLGTRGIIKLPQITFPHRVFETLVAVRKAGQVQPVAVEQHERRIALAGLVPLHTAVLQHQEYSPVVFYDVALLGQDGRALLRITLVVDEDPQQLSIGAPLANVQRKSLLQFDETAGLHDVGDQIGTNFRGPAPQLAQSPRRDVDTDRCDEQRHHDASREERAE